MKEALFGSLGRIKVPIQVYESIDEGNKAAGKTDAMLNEANASLAYRGPLDDARDIICEFVEKTLGMPRATKDSGKKDATGAPIMIIDKRDDGQNYIKRVAAEKGLLDEGGTPDLSRYQDDLTKLFRSAMTEAKNGSPATPLMAIDITKKEREAKEPKLAQKFLDSAKTILASKNWGRWVKDVKSLTGIDVVKTVDGEKEEDQLKRVGKVVKAFSDAKVAEEKKALEAKQAEVLASLA